MQPPNAPKQTSRPRSPRGAWTILAIFALGGAVLAGLFWWPRPRPPAAPPGVTFGVPAGGLGVVVYQTAAADGRFLTAGEIAADLRGRFPSPDLLILLDILPDEAPILAGLLGTRESYDPRLCQRVRRPGRPDTAVCILSPHPLYEGAPLKAGRREVVGAAAVAVVGGRKFLVAGIASPGDAGTVPFTDVWTRAGSPPALVGGDIGRAAGQTLTGAGFSGAGAGSPPAERRLMASADWVIEVDAPLSADAGRGTGFSARVSGSPLAVSRPTTRSGV